VLGAQELRSATAVVDEGGPAGREPAAAARCAAGSRDPGRRRVGSAREQTLVGFGALNGALASVGFVALATALLVMQSRLWLAVIKDLVGTTIRARPAE
jgi:hypothetical protein